MCRFFLVLFLCAIFMACSSDGSSALDKWFSDQGLATSYGSSFKEFYVEVKDSKIGFNDSVHWAGSYYIALGEVNGIKQSLYFGLNFSDTIPEFLGLRSDSIFYEDIYKGNFPEEQKKSKVKIYWLKDSAKPDSTWIKLENTSFTDSAETSIDWEISGSGNRDSLLFNFPNEFINFVENNKTSDTLRVLMYIKPLFDYILRIDPPDLRIAQKTEIEDNGCELCLHSGVRESLYVVLDGIGDSIDKSKTLVFAQLILKQDTTDAETINELGLPVPVYVYSKLYNDGDTTTLDESYRVDTDYVNENESHPNLLFSGDDTLKLQVTKKLRHYANSANLPDTLFLTLGSPVLKPQSIYFYNHYDENSDYVKVISDRSSFSVYNFNNALSKGDSVKLRLWYADYGNEK